MDGFGICFEIEVTGFLDGLDVKNEGMDKPNLCNMAMPLMAMQETGGRVGGFVPAPGEAWSARGELSNRQFHMRENRQIRPGDVD